MEIGGFSASATGNVFVRQEANVPSDGRLTDIDIGAFLSARRNPEHQALLHLIGTLVEGRPHRAGGKSSGISAADTGTARERRSAPTRKPAVPSVGLNAASNGPVPPALPGAGARVLRAPARRACRPPVREARVLGA
jgi:hypothetical protein